jgi:hypothetical protein
MQFDKNQHVPCHPVSLHALNLHLGHSLATITHLRCRLNANNLHLDRTHCSTTLIPLGWHPILGLNAMNFFQLNSHGGYYTSLLSQDVADDFVSDDYVLVDNEAVQSPVLNEMSSQATKRCRSKNFSEEEDTLLVSAYLNVSKDPITGRDKKDGTFWERVWKYFHKNRTFELDRNWSSLKHRWGIIQKEVNIFHMFIQQFLHITTFAHMIYPCHFVAC